MYLTLLGSSLLIKICNILVLNFTLVSSSLHIHVCNVSAFYLFFFVARPSILTSAIFQFCIFYFAFLVCTYWHLGYFISVYFTLLSSSLHIDICSISVLYILLCFPSLCILASAVFHFYIYFFSFPRLYILTSAVLYFCILYFSFLVPAYCHLQYFSFVYFILLSLFVDILYSLLSFPHPYILTCAVFQFCIFHFTLLVSSY